MRKAKVLYKDELAGIIIQNDDASFEFVYDVGWLGNSSKPSISPTLPKSQHRFQSKLLFPFFFNLLPEGSNKDVVCKYNKIDPDDYFGILMVVAKYDTIGAVKVLKEEE